MQSTYLGAWFYIYVGMEVIKTPDFNDLNRWVNTFNNIVNNNNSALFIYDQT